jgi:hypothetical protein
MKKRKSGDKGPSQLNRQGPTGNSGTTSPMGQIQPPSQTANFWISVQNELPQYYQNVIIFTGTEVLHNWARVSDGDHDYYVRTYYSSEVPDKTIDHITHWCDPNNLKDFTLEKDEDTTQTAKILWSPEEYKTGLSNEFEKLLTNDEKLKQECFNPTVYMVQYHPNPHNMNHTPWTTLSIHKSKDKAKNKVKKYSKVKAFEFDTWRVEPIILED